MWEMLPAHPGGRLSFRNIFLFVATLLVTVFAALFITAAPAHAADATWKDGTIVYNNDTYTGPNTIQGDSAGYGLEQGTKVYVSAEHPVTFGSRDHKVIYFPAGSTPETASSAQFVTYRANNATGKLSNKSSPTTISLDATTASQPSTDGAANEASSCQIRGIGWIVCPITTFLADGMDWVFDLLKQFVEVTIFIGNDNNTAMYRAWQVMQGIANVAFVIAFIIIIYSQLTSVGLSNYGIKKLLPRIIIAAILVNISYWICVVAVDLSNILGNSLQSVFIGLRDAVGIHGDATPEWKDIAQVILTGGAIGSIAIGGTIVSATSVGAAGGLIFLLLPILVGAATTVLIVVFILAARQALITILVIIAPLALVAYLLPNTEKWFEKWRSLFMTMLIFFPAFSVVFGGSQFAGSMIINAATNGTNVNIVMVLLGMAVQIAPLAITPLLLKLSGTLLSRIGGLVNDPTRGVKDRTKNWSNERREAYRANQMAKTRQMAKEGRLKGRHIVRRSALATDNARRLREGRKSTSETMSDNYFNQTEGGKTLDNLQRTAEREKQIVQQELDKTWNVKAKIDPTSLEREIELRVSTDEVNLSKLRLDSVYEEIKAGNRTHAAEVLGAAVNGGPTINDPQVARRLDMLNRAADTTSYLAVEGMRKSAAEQEQKNSLSKQLELNQGMVDGKKMLDYAGGIQGEAGAQRALASAFSMSLSAYEDNIKNANAIIGHGNPEDADVTRLITTKIGETDKKTGIKVTEDIRIAAIRKIAGGKNADELVNMLRHADIPGMSQDERQEMGEALLANGATPKWLGAGAKAAIKQGKVAANGNDRINDWIVSTIRDGKLSSAETLVNQDKTFIAEVTNTLRDPAARARIQPEHLAKLKQEMHTTLLHDSRYSGRIGERDTYFESLYNEIGALPGSPVTYADAKATAP